MSSQEEQIHASHYNEYTEKTYLLLTYLLIYSMEQSPSSEANPFLTSQEISRISWNPKAQHRTQKCSPPVPILSQIDPGHSPIPLPQDPSQYYPPIYAWVLQVVCSKELCSFRC
jgi:hypothetical protein